MMTPEEEKTVHEFLTKRVSEMHEACDRYESKIQRLTGIVAAMEDGCHKCRRVTAFQIPKRFKLYGSTISVVFNPTLLHTDDARGVAVYRDHKIILQPVGEQNPLPATQVEQSFCHELVHFLFHAAGYPEDRADETKVERVSQLFHQALTTMEYE